MMVRNWLDAIISFTLFWFLFALCTEICDDNLWPMIYHSLFERSVRHNFRNRLLERIMCMYRHNLVVFGRNLWRIERHDSAALLSVDDYTAKHVVLRHDSAACCSHEILLSNWFRRLASSVFRNECFNVPRTIVLVWEEICFFTENDLIPAIYAILYVAAIVNRKHDRVTVG